MGLLRCVLVVVLVRRLCEMQVCVDCVMLVSVRGFCECRLCVDCVMLVLMLLLVRGWREMWVWVAGG